MIRPAIIFGAVASAAYAADLHRSAAAWAKGEVFYVSVGTDCPPGWRNRSAHADLQAAYEPSAARAGSDMCLGAL